MGLLRSLTATAFLAAGLVAAQEDDRPFKPTVDSLLMAGTGCPIGGGGIMAGLKDGTPIFKFNEWNLDLDDLEEDPETGEMAETVDKFCIQQIKLGNSPPGYQVRIAGATISGKAVLEEGSVLGILVESRLDEVPAGEGEIYIESDDLDGENFEVRIDTAPEEWSECVGEDGIVPTIHITATLALWREGDPDSVGTVGSSDPDDMDSALSVHFEPVWRKCE